jgi:alpha-N-acetylglucosamine transferase
MRFPTEKIISFSFWKKLETSKGKRLYEFAREFTFFLQIFLNSPMRKTKRPSSRLYLSLYFPRQTQILDLIDGYLQETKAYAYATLVMNGNRYVAGAAVLGTKLRELQQKKGAYFTYCFVTHDVDTAARQLLSRCFDHVVQVPYLRATTRRMITARQRELYESWISSSFTKWNIFNPGVYKGRAPEKVLLLDSDLLPRRNLDHLFELPAPAACFSNCFSTRYMGPRGIREIYERKRRLVHGEEISPDLVIESLHHKDDTTFAVSAVTVLVEPNEEVYREMLRLLKPHQVQRIPYGFEGVFSGFDEQMLCQLMLYLHEHQKKRITHLDPGYVWNAGKDSWVREEKRHVIHYFGNEKPWFVPLKKQYPDTQEWWNVANPLRQKHPELSKYLFIK